LTPLTTAELRTFGIARSVGLFFNTFVHPKELVMTKEELCDLVARLNDGDLEILLNILGERIILCGAYTRAEVESEVEEEISPEVFQDFVEFCHTTEWASFDQLAGEWEYFKEPMNQVCTNCGIRPKMDDRYVGLKGGVLCYGCVQKLKEGSKADNEVCASCGKILQGEDERGLVVQEDGSASILCGACFQKA
jgi:hypothetical protein